ERTRIEKSWDAVGKDMSDDRDEDQRPARPKRKKESGDRFQTLNSFVDVTMRDLTPSEKIVWFVLYRDVRNGVVSVSQTDVATRSGLTQSTVSLAIQKLVKRNLVQVVKQGGFRKGLSTYRIRGSV
ncbi:MAG: MarR family transcriptional regulator, partial [Pirellula sp.]